MKIINEKEFNEIIKEGITLVDFYADWCGPCKMLSPILEGLENEYPDVKFVKVNCDDEMDLCVKYNIMSIPAVYLFKDNNLIDKSIGYKDASAMKKFIEKA